MQLVSAGNEDGVQIMIEKNVRWVTPEAASPQTVKAREYRRPDKITFRLGILDNAKSNADHLLRMVSESLQATVPVASVIRRRKPGPARPAETALLDELMKEADFVVSAMAD